MKEKDFRKLVIKGLRVIVYLLSRKYDADCERAANDFIKDADRTWYEITLDK